MAVKTRFDDADFTAILSNYALGAYARSQPISAGTVQTNYILQTTGGRFIFRCYENRSKASVQFECSLVAYLKGKQYPCPAPYKDRKGNYVGIFHGKPYAIFEFIEGQHLENPSRAQEAELIQKVAELHHLTRHYRPVHWEQRWNYGPALCQALAQKSAQTLGTANARKKLEWFTGAVSDLRLPRSLPKGICHCDFHFSNILFKGGQFAALIDFDDANYTYLSYDLVTLMDPFIPAFTWDTWAGFARGADILDFQSSRWVAAEYAQYRPLNAVEKKHLFDLYKLSILLDCVWYFARGDADDFYEKRKIEALDRLGRDGFYEALFS